MGNKVQAVEFFRQLDIFSDRFVKAELGLSTSTSPWGSSMSSEHGPKGAIIHYTADDDILRVLRWFLDAKWNAKCSAHAVVADRKLGTSQEMTKDLPLVAELPVTVVQCRLPTQEAWHATWTNDFTYGIENVNVGELRKSEDGEKFVQWRPRDKSSPDWTMPWTSPYKAPVGLYGRFWEPYTQDQIAANVALLRYVRDYFGEGKLQRPWIVGHEAAQGVDTRSRGGHGQPMRTEKRDPGPTFPIHGVRYAVFDNWTPVGRYDWYNNHAGDPRFGQSDRDSMVVRVVRAVAGRPESPGAADPTPETAWARFKSGFQASMVNGGSFGVWGKLALWLLGYHVSSIKEGELADGGMDSEDIQSVWMFQRLMGITTDGNPGIVTREKLWNRLKDRGFITE